MTARMSIEELRALLDIHGGDESRWPDERRAAMRALCATDERARALLEEARRLDALMSATLPAPNAQLKAAILAAALQEQSSLSSLDKRTAVQEPFSTSSPRKRGSRARIRKCLSLLVFALDSRFRGNDENWNGSWTPVRLRGNDETWDEKNKAANDNIARRWLTGAALAASLVIGLWIGLSGLADPLGGALLGQNAQVAQAGDDALSDIITLASAPEETGDLL